MSDLKDANETAQRMNRLKEALERQKRREPGIFERYNYEILDYLRYKFPEESESAIQEAAAFISNRTAIVIQDINEEMSQAYMKTFCDMIQKREEQEKKAQMKYTGSFQFFVYERREVYGRYKNERSFVAV